MALLCGGQAGILAQRQSCKIPISQGNRYWICLIMHKGYLSSCQLSYIVISSLIPSPVSRHLRQALPVICFSSVATSRG